MNGMNIMNMCSQIHSVLFQYVISNTLFFILGKNLVFGLISHFEFLQVFLLSICWILFSYLQCLSFSLDFYCIFSSFLFELTFFLHFKGKCCTYLLLSFPYSSLHISEKMCFFPFIGNSSLSFVTLLLSFPNSDLCYFSYIIILFFVWGWLFKKFFIKI